MKIYFGFGKVLTGNTKFNSTITNQYSLLSSQEVPPSEGFREAFWGCNPHHSIQHLLRLSVVLLVGRTSLLWGTTCHPPALQQHIFIQLLLWSRWKRRLKEKKNVEKIITKITNQIPRSGLMFIAMSSTHGYEKICYTTLKGLNKLHSTINYNCNFFV
jgi:hypothetical protein